MIRTCDGNDPNLKRERVALVAGQEDVSWVPCDCGLTFDDVQRLVIYPHFFIPLPEHKEAVQVRMEEMLAAGMTAAQISEQLTSQPVSTIVGESPSTTEGSPMGDVEGFEGQDTTEAVGTEEQHEAADSDDTETADDAVDSDSPAEQNPGL